MQLPAQRSAAARFFMTPQEAVTPIETLKVAALLYGAASYAVFLGVFLYAIGFVADVVVPAASTARTTRRCGKR